MTAFSAFSLQQLLAQSWTLATVMIWITLGGSSRVAWMFYVKHLTSCFSQLIMRVMLNLFVKYTPEPYFPTSLANELTWKQSQDQSISSWVSSMACSTGSAPQRYASLAALCSPRPARMTRWSNPVAVHAKHWGRTAFMPLKASKWPGPTFWIVTASLPVNRRGALTHW